MSSLTKLLWSSNRKGSIIMSSFGLLIGYFVVLVSVNIYLIVNSTINKDETLFSKDFLVINKEVSFLNTLSLAQSDFSEKELDEIREQPFVKSLSPFISNSFKIGAYNDPTDKIPGFYTELFFQSIPSGFLNIKDKKWKWKKGQKEIPIIFPGDYLKLYNFGFAKSQGLPQVSAETIGKVSFNVKIEGKGKTTVFRARIIGITDKVNSVLVPIEFMNWANKEYGSDEAVKSSMLLLEANNISNPEIFEFLKKHHYETNTERIKNSKTTVFLRIIFAITLTIGLLITVLSLLLFILSLNLIIVKSKEEIVKLFHIGYKLNQLVSFYGILLIIILLLINILVLLALYFGIIYFSQFLVSAGFDPGAANFYSNILYASCLSCFVFVINILSLRYQLRRIK